MAITHFLFIHFLMGFMGLIGFGFFKFQVIVIKLLRAFTYEAICGYLLLFLLDTA